MECSIHRVRELRTTASFFPHTDGGCDPFISVRFTTYDDKDRTNQIRMFVPWDARKDIAQALRDAADEIDPAPKLRPALSGPFCRLDTQKQREGVGQ